MCPQNKHLQAQNQKICDLKTFHVGGGTFVMESRRVLKCDLYIVVGL
jgi:hypothetical protein